MGTSQFSGTNPEFGCNRESFFIYSNIKKILSIFFEKDSVNQLFATIFNINSKIKDFTEEGLQFRKNNEQDKDETIEKLHYDLATNQLTRIVLVLNYVLGELVNTENKELDLNTPGSDMRKNINSYIALAKDGNFSQEMDSSLFDPKLLQSLNIVAEESNTCKKNQEKMKWQPL